MAFLIYIRISIIIIILIRKRYLAFIQTNNIKGDFLFFVGSLEPRKNLEFLLSIQPELYRRTGKQLVIVGAKAWRSSSLKTIVEAADFPKESVVFCKFVPDVGEDRRLLKFFFAQALDQLEDRIHAKLRP